MKRILVAVAVALVAVALTAACVGSDPVLTSPSPDASASGSGGPVTSGPACPNECLPKAPDGWRGPTALFEGIEKDACPAPFPARETISAEILNPGPHTCDCGTFKPFSHACQVEFSLATDAACGTVIRSISHRASESSKCFDNANAEATHLTKKEAFLDGICIPDQAGEKSPPNLDRRYKSLCVVPECPDRPDCRARVEPIASPFTRLCVYHGGDEPTCPSAYPIRFLTHRDVVDKRACSDCTAKLEGECGQTMEVFTGDGCSGAATDYVGPCTALPSPPKSFGFAKSQPKGLKCSITGGVASGAVELRDPLTICCDR